MDRNSFKYTLSQVFYVCTGLLTAGTVLQTFLLELGLDEQTIAGFESIMLAVQSLSMFVFARTIEDKKDIRGIYATTTLFSDIMLLPMLMLCFIGVKSLGLAFGVICMFTLINRVLGGVKIVSMYKLPYQIIDMKNYGRLTAISAIASGICAVLFSTLITVLNRRYGFFESMKYVIVAGIFMVVLSYFSIVTSKIINEHKSTKDNLSYGEIFRYKPFYKLLFPNLLRGIYLGIFNVAVVIGYHNGALDSNGAIALTLVTQASQVLGAFVYSKVCQSKHDGRLILVFALMSIAPLAFIVTSSTYVFFISFYIAKLLTIVVDNAVPVAVAKIVDYKHIGRYSALRLFTNTLGTAIGSAIIIPILDIFGKAAALSVTGGCIAIFALSYYFYFKKNTISVKEGD